MLKEKKWKLWVLIPLCLAALVVSLLLGRYWDILITVGLVLIGFGYDRMTKNK